MSRMIMPSDIKRLIRALPGPKSYCKCTVMCSPLEIEHVIPKSYLKQSFSKSKSDVIPNAVWNPHNLFTCCSYLNRLKADNLYGDKFFLPTNSYHYGALARASLYMTEYYNLKMSNEIVQYWIDNHNKHPPQPFEFRRNEMIFKNVMKSNSYLPAIINTKINTKITTLHD